MDNSERIKKWKEERARVAEESRDSRLRKKEEAHLLRQAEKAAEQHGGDNHKESDWAATDADAVRRASLIIKERRIEQAKQSLRRLFLYIGLPLLAIMFMSWLLTSRFYSADATFIVQSEASQDNFSGAAFFGSGNEMSEGFQVREFILSKEMMDRMEKELGFLTYFSQRDIALFSRYNAPLGINSDPYRYYLSKVSVSADIQQGMLRLNVMALDAQKAEFFAQRILEFAEQHVNTVSARMQQERILWLENDVKTAQENLSAVRLDLLKIQHIQKDIEPQETVTAIYQLIAGFETQRAEAKAEYDQLMANGLDQNPQIPRLVARMTVLKKLISEQRNRLSNKLGSQGSSESLSLFEDLRLQGEIAKTRWESALQTLQQGKLQALRERRYLLVISQPMVVSDSRRYDDGAKWLMFFVLLAVAYIVISLLIAIRRMRE
ncbi:Vi polysaccharide ABC transporter inner membrane protein VexD [Citrobacter amalonaticus]|uniref:Vi polysaccharide ABC transporter inner membrane protein VexD n=1 Tax=Citrobacter amalonaticus TaxID=35703 RepID=A0A2S4RVR9_CITAM|nr:Vi polysaccharide ABC transporter inner membrane protein VexD [Citrobacter amalonaticus]POT56330.1 Vi polysaccharide ABC transporter inner membrane protein VexD [Citrobacter amalonaticus]POT74855.1 Vi polysaccharide ABC transporter inner membrane protein VexD [Citrobacter amalonaticus]POU64384.1 Vi polysaccharide ABC transporter inner membrane protein VexD [Citrobacter amalonaticus]POV04220.1 Vi polysaccharide ABC transporter inner membrane protein VexD [Citrobacter amalonaticus]